MTTAPAIAGQPSGEDLTVRIFCALYPEFDLRAIDGTYVVAPKGVRWFAGHSLGNIACQISDHPSLAAGKVLAAELPTRPRR